MSVVHAHMQFITQSYTCYAEARYKHIYPSAPENPEAHTLEEHVLQAGAACAVDLLAHKSCAGTHNNGSETTLIKCLS